MFSIMAHSSSQNAFSLSNEYSWDKIMDSAAKMEQTKTRFEIVAEKSGPWFLIRISLNPTLVLCYGSTFLYAARNTAAKNAASRFLSASVEVERAPNAHPDKTVFPITGIGRDIIGLYFPVTWRSLSPRTAPASKV